MDDAVIGLLGAIVGSLVSTGALWKIGKSVLESEFVANRRLFDEHDRPLFPSRDEINGMSHRRDEQIADLTQKIEAESNFIVRVDDRVGKLEKDVALMEERQTHEWRAIAKDMALTAQSVKDTAGQLSIIAIRMERIDNTTKEK